MKIETKMIGWETVLSLQEIFCNTVLETEEGNKLAICMRDDTIEMAVVGTGKWHRVDMATGSINEMANVPESPKGTQQFDKRKGILNPIRTDNLIAGVIEYIGLYCIWEAMWVIEEGQYKGQWAMAPRTSVGTVLFTPFVWAPECDITFDEHNS